MTLLSDRQAKQSEAAPSAAEPQPLASATAWRRRYLIVLLALDTLMLLAATWIGTLARFGFRSVRFEGVPYTLVALTLVPAWLCALVASRSYDMRHVGAGSEEFKRVANASIRLVALVAFIAFAARLNIARGYLAAALPVGMILLLLERYTVRKLVHQRRKRGQWTHRVLAVGGAAGVVELMRQTAREPYAGYQVVAACVPSVAADDLLRFGVPIVGSLTSMSVDLTRELGVDTVAFTGGPGMNAAALRRLSWDLEGSGLNLVVAPALTDVAGPRISIRPVAGLPLLHVDEPDYGGPMRLAVHCVERVAAAMLLLVASPVLAVIGIVVRATSPGPALFRQIRVGHGGREFTLFKMRTMHVGAEDRLAELADRNDFDGLLFKLREDPRITRVGRWLRRYSLDELPQLWNVVRGDMALVGPRPPLPSEVAQYGNDVLRRLLVKPGITGLWQVSGRSDLSWEDSVRLDLYYVENWSPALDLLIMWKTLGAVAKRHGAY